MNKYYKISLIGLLALVIILTIILLNNAYRQNKPTKSKVIVKKVFVKQKIIQRVVVNKIDRNKFVNWIYNNSFRCSKKQAEDIANILLKTKYPLLFASIIKNESSFNITAYSKSGAIGLMQVLPTQAHLKQLKSNNIINEPRDLFNADQNILAGQLIFMDILKINKGNLEKALLMYCGGNKNYVNKVLQSLGELTIYVRTEKLTKKVIDNNAVKER